MEFHQVPVEINVFWQDFEASGEEGSQISQINVFDVLVVIRQLSKEARTAFEDGYIEYIAVVGTVD